MSLKAIANEDVTLTITTAMVNGSITIVSSASAKVNAPKEKGVFFKEIEFNVSGLTKQSCGSITPGSNNGLKILATASKVRDINGDAVMRLGDKLTGIQSTGATRPPPQSPQSCTITYDVEITDAGQTKVKAE